MKKYLSVLLCFVFLGAMMTPAWAGDQNVETHQGTKETPANSSDEAERERDTNRERKQVNDE